MSGSLQYGDDIPEGTSYLNQLELILMCKKFSSKNINYTKRPRTKAP